MDVEDIVEHAEIVGLIGAGVIFVINLIVYGLSLPLAFSVAAAVSGMVTGVCRQSGILADIG